MSANQVENGKAFEYACLESLYGFLSKTEDVSIIQSPQLNTARKSFRQMDASAKEHLIKAADAAVRVIVRLEPQLQFSRHDIPLFISIQADAAGIGGDVRDVLCLRHQNNWEIGISCKHNHQAVKHSRLSATIDFGKEWLGMPCSKSYFDKVGPVFNELAAIKSQSKAANNPVKWCDIENKPQRFYMPILNAFVDELMDLHKRDKNVPALLVQYLLGRFDFYKVISDEHHKTTRVEAININGSLNRGSDGHKSIADVARLKLPTKFYHIGFKQDSDTTIEVVCDEGWSMSMRIHNASTYVEPSLKFDVQLISLPSSIYAQVEPWEE